MFAYLQFFGILPILIITSLNSTSNLIMFAVYSELLWLSLYVVTCLVGGLCATPSILSLPFIILVLTAVEAAVVWVFVVYSFKLKI